MDGRELQKKTVKVTWQIKTKPNIDGYIPNGGNMPHLVLTGINSLSLGRHIHSSPSMKKIPTLPVPIRVRGLTHKSQQRAPRHEAIHTL